MAYNVNFGCLISFVKFLSKSTFIVFHFFLNYFSLFVGASFVINEPD